MDLGNKNVGILYVSERGKKLSEWISGFLPNSNVARLSHDILKDFWIKKDQIIFISALGIAVRYISGFVKDKATDPGVVVVDELGKHCISLLSGHMGGANAFTLFLAERLKASPVITTLSDLLGLIAPDMWAQALNLNIEPNSKLSNLTNKLITEGVLNIYFDEIKLPTPAYYVEVKEVDKADMAVSYKIETKFSSLPLFRPKVLYVGIGFNNGTKAERMYECLKKVFDDYKLSVLSIDMVGTLDKKREDPEFKRFLATYGLSARYFSPEELNRVRPKNPSQQVYDSLGVWGVSEPASLLLSNMGDLIVPKVKFPEVTIAVSKKREEPQKGSLKVVGIGPGHVDYLLPKAKKALLEADIVVGYEKYLRQVNDLLLGKERYATGMTREVERCRKAIELALKGKRVALVSGGDPNVYGMAGLVLEIISKEFPDSLNKIAIEVIPGISAHNIASALLGGALMHDFACISLSDRLTSWELIEKRLRSAAESDMVIVLYNPKSKGRQEHLDKALKIISCFRDKRTPVGIVRGATREGEKVKICELGEVPTEEVDMETLLIVGNTKSFQWQGMLITPRGYEL